MPSDNAIYSGLIRLHILHHASKEPIFGLGIIEELGRHGYRLSAGTLYPLLHGLEREGHLRSFEKKKRTTSPASLQSDPQGPQGIARGEDQGPGAVRRAFRRWMSKPHRQKAGITVRLPSDGPSLSRQIVINARMLKEIAVSFLRLGTTAFGGPAAHIAMMEEEFVRRRGWVSHADFLDMLGASNLVPWSEFDRNGDSYRPSTRRAGEGWSSRACASSFRRC